MAAPVRGVRAALAILALLVLARPASAQPAAAAPDPSATVTRASGRCGLCHPSQRVAFEKSPHATEDMRCVSCHGGNDQAFDEGGAHQGNGWRGHLTKQDDPGLCASCHSDEKKMRPYDLPVDQMALYQTSGHGTRLRAGDTKVAVCSDCHGSHDILPANDPSSRVYVTNIPATCGNCHGDSTKVHPKAGHDVYREYLSSVHARKLFDDANRQAPTCVSCHGVHGAAPSEVGDVNKICGRCHTAERRYFLAGPHAAGMARKNMGECSSCHGDHAIGVGNTDRLASGCLECHLKGTKEAAMGDHLLADYKSATAAIAEADAMVAKADAVPLQTDDYRARVEEARTYLREAMTAAHAVQPDVMANFTVRARDVGSEVRKEIDDKLRNILIEKLALVVFWFYVLITVGILRRFRDRDDRKG